MSPAFGEVWERDGSRWMVVAPDPRRKAEAYRVLYLGSEAESDGAAARLWAARRIAGRDVLDSLAAFPGSRDGIVDDALRRVE